MLKELTSKEISDFAKEFETNSEENLLLEETSTLMESGDKIIAKLKETAAEKCINVYVYDKKLYRYTLKYKVAL